MPRAVRSAASLFLTHPYNYVSPNWSESYAHQMVGLMMLVPAFLLILGVGWVLDQIFIEEADDGAPPPPPEKPKVIRKSTAPRPPEKP